MSFSGDVKRELGKQYSKGRHCQLAELAAILEMVGRVQEKPCILEITSDNMVVLEKYAVLMRQLFEVDITKPLEGNIVEKILTTLKFFKEDGLALPLDEQRVDGLLVQNVCCKRAFIRGAFLASGSMSDPNKSYHFEIVCRTMEQAEQLQQLMNGFETEAKIVERKGHYVVYLKEGSQIVDMLNVMEAYISLMNLENVRILKEMRNSVNRKGNCETANISKTVNAAVKQLEDIELIRSKLGLDQLPQNLREMALIRLEYPEAALKELGNYLTPPVGKSGVNHRLRKLAEIAEDLRGEYE